MGSTGYSKNKLGPDGAGQPPGAGTRLLLTDHKTTRPRSASSYPTVAACAMRRDRAQLRSVRDRWRRVARVIVRADSGHTAGNIVPPKEFFLARAEVEIAEEVGRRVQSRHDMISHLSAHRHVGGSSTHRWPIPENRASVPASAECPEVSLRAYESGRKADATSRDRGGRERSGRNVDRPARHGLVGACSSLTDDVFRRGQ